MKFFTIEIPVYVKSSVARTPQTLRVEMTGSDAEAASEVVERLGRILQEKLDTVDLGDCE